MCQLLVLWSIRRNIPCVTTTNKIRFIDHSNTLNTALHEFFLLLCAFPLLPFSFFITFMPLESTTF